METRDNKIFFMLTSALMKGSGMHIINAMNNKSRTQAIQDIEIWYGSAATSRTIIDHYRLRLEGIKLTEETTASSYVNKFLIFSSKIEKKREGYTATTKRHKFLDQIKDDKYNVVKQQLQGDTSIDFDAYVKRIRSREQDISTDEKLEENGRARRFVKKEGNVNPNKNDGAKRKYDLPDGKIPSIPGYILSKINTDDVRTDLIRWRGICNDKKKDNQG